MVLTKTVRQAYRAYGVATVLWAGWSLAWVGTGIEMEPAVVGYGWLAIAVVGFVLVGSMAAMRVSAGHQLFRTQRSARIDRFDDHVLGNTLLPAYVVALAGWSVLTVEWWTVHLGIVGRTTVGYGWLLIALCGLGLTIGLASKHRDDLRDAADELTPGDADAETP